MSSEVKNGIKTFYAKSPKDWRSWLQKNGDKEKNVWLIIYKKESGKPSVNYKEAVEEALCFGWIDSKPNKRDDLSYYQFFAKRAPKSKWSKVNKDRVEQLIKSGKMQQSGLAAIAIGKSNGAWDALNDTDNGIVPADLQKAFNRNKKALQNFNNFPNSSKKIILEWIRSAKKEETRAKRIEETITLAAKNIRANHYRQ